MKLFKSKCKQQSTVGNETKPLNELKNKENEKELFRKMKDMNEKYLKKQLN